MNAPLPLILCATALRLALVAYSEAHDRAVAPTAVAYTDVDYRVAVEAGQALLAGTSPYTRATFRYPPLLALLATVDSLLCPGALKILYTVADAIVAALLVYSFNAHWLLVAGAYVLNPVVVGVTTRGSCDALTVLSVLLLLRAALASPHRRNDSLLGALLAGCVHWRLYPIVFTPSLAFFLFCSAAGEPASGSSLRNRDVFRIFSSRQLWRASLPAIFDFGTAFVGTLFLLTLGGFWW